MRIAVFSDVHANREALLEVEKRLSEEKIDRIFFLGDAVGYNADPELCVQRIFSLTETMVRGNHDKTVCQLENLEWFNQTAREALLWTRNALQEASLGKLLGMRAGPLLVEGRYLICHGSPMDEDLYITQAHQLTESFRYMHRHHPEAWICFFGHTHVPLTVQEGGRAVVPPQRMSLDPKRRYLINPGSVGQPRDGVPMAAFGILDEQAMEYRHFRVPFPIRRVQEKILNAGLPSVLAERLAEGW